MAFSKRSSWAGFESFFFEGGGREGLVTLLWLGPKARVCWARTEGLEGLRRVGGIVAMVDLYEAWGRGYRGVVLQVNMVSGD